MERTEEQKVLMEPITVRFGETDYDIPILPIKKSRAWRKQFYGAVGKLPNFTEAEGIKSYEDLAAAVFVAIPDAVIDLVFAYAFELNRDEIEDVATDTQMAEALRKFTEVAFPLAAGLIEAMGIANRPSR